MADSLPFLERLSEALEKVLEEDAMPHYSEWDAPEGQEPLPIPPQEPMHHVTSSEMLRGSKLDHPRSGTVSGRLFFAPGNPDELANEYLPEILYRYGGDGVICTIHPDKAAKYRWEHGEYPHWYIFTNDAIFWDDMEVRQEPQEKFLPDGPSIDEDEEKVIAPKANRFCAWCKKALGYDPALDVPSDDPLSGGPSHGICKDCKKKMLGEARNMSTEMGDFDVYAEAFPKYKEAPEEGDVLRWELFDATGRVGVGRFYEQEDGTFKEHDVWIDREAQGQGLYPQILKWLRSSYSLLPDDTQSPNNIRAWEKSQ